MKIIHDEDGYSIYPESFEVTHTCSNDIEKVKKDYLSFIETSFDAALLNCVMKQLKKK